MNKLLAISVALLSLNLYGADKPKVLADKTFFSERGLEGFGINGIEIWTDKVIVEKYYVGKFVYDYQAAIDVIELALIRAGYKVVKESDHKIFIDVLHHIDNPIRKDKITTEGTLDSHEVTLVMKRMFTFKTNGKTYSTYGICNRTFRFHDYPFYEKNKYLKSYVNLMVTLLSRANPKKKEK